MLLVVLRRLVFLCGFRGFLVFLLLHLWLLLNFLLLGVVLFLELLRLLLVLLIELLLRFFVSGLLRCSGAVPLLLLLDPLPFQVLLAARILEFLRTLLFGLRIHGCGVRWVCGVGGVNRRI